jgi:hypothetical protein
MRRGVRAFGEFKPVSAEAFATAQESTRAELGFEDGVVVIEHEGGPIDHEAIVAALAAGLGEGGWGWLDVIDHQANMLHRYQVENAEIHVVHRDLDDATQNMLG